MEKFYINRFLPHWGLLFFFKIMYLFHSLHYLCLLHNVNLWWFSLVMHCLWVQSLILGVQNLDLIFCFVNDCFKAWSTHPTKFSLSGSMWLLINIVVSLNFLNDVLKNLKQDTFNGYNACDVGDGNVIMFNPNSFAYSIASTKLTNVGCWRTFHLDPRI